MAELHMYQQGMVSKYISFYVIIITKYTKKFFLSYHSKINIPWSSLFNNLNLRFSTSTKKKITVDVQMKVKKMMREKYLLKSCSRNRKRVKKEEKVNGQNI